MTPVSCFVAVLVPASVAQPANLFEVPAGYTKFDMGSTMQRPQ